MRGKAILNRDFILTEEMNVLMEYLLFYIGTLIGNPSGCSSHFNPGCGPKEGWGNSGGKFKAIHINQLWKNTYMIHLGLLFGACSRRGTRFSLGLD